MQNAWLSILPPIITIVIAIWSKKIKTSNWTNYRGADTSKGIYIVKIDDRSKIYNQIIIVQQ